MNSEITILKSKSELIWEKICLFIKIFRKISKRY